MTVKKFFRRTMHDGTPCDITPEVRPGPHRYLMIRVLTLIEQNEQNVARRLSSNASSLQAISHVPPAWIWARSRGIVSGVKIACFSLEVAPSGVCEAVNDGISRGPLDEAPDWQSGADNAKTVTIPAICKPPLRSRR